MAEQSPSKPGVFDTGHFRLRSAGGAALYPDCEFAGIRRGRRVHQVEDACRRLQPLLPRRQRPLGLRLRQLGKQSFNQRMCSLRNLSWSLHRLCRRCRTLRFTVQVAIRVPVELPFQFLAVSFQHPLQPVLRPKVRGIPLVGAVQLAGQIPVAVLLRSAVAILVAGLLPVSLQTVQVVVRAPRRTVQLWSRLEGRHDWAIASEKCHSSTTMQKYNFSLNGTLR
jgi:hypothetical protein